MMLTAEPGFQGLRLKDRKAALSRIGPAFSWTSKWREGRLGGDQVFRVGHIQRVMPPDPHLHVGSTDEWVNLAQGVRVGSRETKNMHWPEPW